MASDGKVTISTKLDTKGLEKGIRNVSGSLGGLPSVLKKIGGAVAIAFSVSQIVRFGKAAVEASTTLTNAMMGLQSIVEGQGRSFSKAKQFIEEYTADGLIPAANAITAYKNLAARGYSNDQIVKTLTALKDAAAFGRQSSYTMGEAVQSASEGLKNENSLLVDNAGVTKNVARMWDDYAASIGTTANNLTQEQKILAEVNGILEETRFQTGDAAKVAGTYSGQVARLSANFINFKVAVGNAIIPLAQRVLPVINTILEALTRLANAAASVMGALFGKASINTAAAGNNATASSAFAAAEGEQALADATEAAGKAAKGATAGFDELNVLQQDTGGTATGTGAGTAGGGGLAPITAEAEVEDTISPKVQAIVDKVQQLLQPLKEINFDPLAAAFGRLKDAASPLTQTLFSGLEWAWYNILVPLAGWSVEDFLPAFLDLLASALNFVNEVILALQPGAQWLWDNFLQPLAEWTGGVIVDTLEALAGGLDKISTWISEHQGEFTAMTAVVAAFMAVWKGAEIAEWIINAGGVVGLLTTLKTNFWALTGAKIADKLVDLQIIALYAGDFLKAIVGMIGKVKASAAAWWANTAAAKAFGAAATFLKSPMGLVVVGIAAIIAVIVLLVTHWDEVKAVALATWEQIKETWVQVSGWFQGNVIDPLKAGWEEFKLFFALLWEDIAGGVKGAVNSIIGFVNGMIAALVDGINTVVEMLNRLSFDIPEWVPVYGGKKWGFDLPKFTAPQIPMLAQGAVLPANRPFMAVVGDQRNGTNIEAPLDLIRATMQEVNASMLADMMDAIRSLSGEDKPIEVVVLLDGKEVHRSLQKRSKEIGAGVMGSQVYSY